LKRPSWPKSEKGIEFVKEKMLDGKVAVITGAAQGIGRGYALGLAREGAKVAVADIAEAAATETVELVRAAGGEAEFYKTDVSSSESCNAMAKAAAERFGGIDILVNNAALFAGLPSESMLDMPEATWNKVLAINTTGPFLMARAVVPYMQKRGGGAIVNQTSTAAYIGTPNRMNYNVSKAAVIPMTKTMARELAEYNIRVNAIAPGPVATDALKNVPQAALDRVFATQCVKRIGQPEDLVGGLIFLTSDMSAWMSGQVLVIDGGSTMLG
jgi:NAD(P)-dependent dehydrogenase (short-subunit alcohol dehydrogenase family)